MPNPSETAALIYTTWPDEAAALAAAAVLLNERLIACANLLGPIVSVYRWEGAVQEGREVAVLFKTAGIRAQAAADRIASLHPYDVPAIIRLAVDPLGSAPGFLAWIARETT